MGGLDSRKGLGGGASFCVAIIPYPVRRTRPTRFYPTQGFFVSPNPIYPRTLPPDYLARSIVVEIEHGNAKRNKNNDRQRLRVRARALACA